MYVVFKVQTLNGPVAQLVRAPPCHGGGRGFEPHPGRCYHFPDDNLLETAYNYIWGLSSAGRASALQAEGHRFEPCRSHLTNSFISYADVAQLAEQLICNQQVIGSSPIIGFIQFNIELYYGQIPEWPKGTDCKSAATCFDGSNPSLPITLYRVTKYYRGMEQSGSSPGS